MSTHYIIRVIYFVLYNKKVKENNDFCKEQCISSEYSTKQLHFSCY